MVHLSTFIYNISNSRKSCIYSNWLMSRHIADPYSKLVETNFLLEKHSQTICQCFLHKATYINCLHITEHLTKFQ